MSERPPISADVQRAARKACGFACIFCGSPIYDYHHIVPWSICRSHDPENIVLVCPTHHAQITKGLIDESVVIRQRNTPHSGPSSPHRLHFHGQEFRVQLGGSVWRSGMGCSEFSAITIDGQCVLGYRFQEGSILLNIVLANEQQNLLLIAQEGHVQYVRDYWDIEWKGKKLTLRDRPRNIRLDLEFSPPNEVRLHRGLFLWNGVAIQAGPQALRCHNNGSIFSVQDGVGGNAAMLENDRPIAMAFGLIDEDVQKRAGIQMGGLDRYRSFDLWKPIPDPRLERS